MGPSTVFKDWAYNRHRFSRKKARVSFITESGQIHFRWGYFQRYLRQIQHNIHPCPVAASKIQSLLQAFRGCEGIPNMFTKFSRWSSDRGELGCSKCIYILFTLQNSNLAFWLLTFEVCNDHGGHRSNSCCCCLRYGDVMWSNIFGLGPQNLELVMVVAGRKLAVQFMLPRLGQLEVELWVINQHAGLTSASIRTRVVDIIDEFEVAEVLLALGGFYKFVKLNFQWQ